MAIKYLFLNDRNEIHMFDLMNKLGDLKAKMEEARNRLDTIQVTGTAGDQEVKIILTGNRKVVSVWIAEHLLFPEKQEEVQDLMEVAINRAMAEADRINETEMKAAGKDLLPGLPL